jgi:Bacterial capsule synthesis protein PGA_cap
VGLCVSVANMNCVLIKPMNKRENNTIRIAAVGDLLFTQSPDGTPGRGLETLSAEVRDYFRSCDIVFANLECTLPGKDRVDTEPRVIATEAQIRSIKESGINVVTLGNNHAFDCLDEGFGRTRALLNEIGVPWCGAGSNLTEAVRPVVKEVRDVKIAFVGVVDPSSGMHRFATATESGVAPNDPDRICQMIRRLREEVAVLIVSPHWGMERFRIPSPRQIQQARDYVHAGAAMVLGHHPHVLQGLELYQGAPIAYSLGNFIANDVFWSNGDVLKWNRFERTSCILTADIDVDHVRSVKQIPVLYDGETVRFEKTRWGNHCLNSVNGLLERGITNRRYQHEAFRVQKLMPLLSHFRWSNLRRIHRWHFRKALRLLLTRKN